MGQGVAQAGPAKVGHDGPPPAGPGARAAPADPADLERDQPAGPDPGEPPAGCGYRDAGRVTDVEHIDAVGGVGHPQAEQ